MRLLVLAGGFGTRLQSVLGDSPKALAPVGPVTFLHIQIEHWIEQGLKSFVFLLHHQSEKIISFLKAEKNGLLKDCKVQCLVEPIPMDTGGAVAYAIQQLHLSGDFLVTNADTWICSGIRDLVRSATPSMAVLSLNDISRYGRVKFNDQFHVTHFEEKSKKKGPDWINVGLYHLHCDLFRGWDGQPFSLERSFLPKLVECDDLIVVKLQTNFIDIGIPGDYFRFCQWIASDRKGIL